MFLTRDMDDGIIVDIMNNVLLPQGKYPEQFIMISQLEVCQEGRARRWVLGGR